jgi:hypothetical protein
MKITVLLFLIQFSSFAIISSVDGLPKHNTYFKNYYANFNNWFNRNIYSWKESQNFIPKLNNVNHWYISTTPSKRFYYKWGVGWDPKSEKIFYTLTEAITPTNFKTISTLHDYKCQEETSKLKCLNIQYDKKETPRQLPKSFPLISKGQFYFQQFIVDTQAFYFNGEIKRVYYNLNNIQVNWLPRELQQQIQKIGLETRLPVDKLSIDNEGRIIVYYP